MRAILRLFWALPLALLSSALVGGSALALAVVDLVHSLSKSRRHTSNQLPTTGRASVVIPTWNGRDHLARNLPSVVEAMGHHPGNEIIVVDNASTDGTKDLLSSDFPKVRLLELSKNHGFGGGSNAGVRAAQNDIVILLNNDIRVEPDFLAPLLEGFTDDTVFSVSCQIFFSDPSKVREESGLTQGWWSSGALRVRHRIDDKITRRFPCFYGGGGSTAFDRRKFLELGGFDSLLAPFYLEDTDLGYMAWKRGWKVLYEPRSRVYHEHRGTIGKRFSERQIQRVLEKNYILFAWKNIHDWRLLSAHLARTVVGTLLSAIVGPCPGRPSPVGTWKALLQIPAAVRSRWSAHQLAVVSDKEAFLRPMGACFRDRFHTMAEKPEQLHVLFVSPYPICPPVHGGAVFMEQTCTRLATDTALHLLVMIENPEDRAAHQLLAARCASAEFVLRSAVVPKAFGSLLPHAVREFTSDDFCWALHREAYLNEVDVIQLEYLSLAQYGDRYRRLALTLFEHDVYFQSVGRVFQTTGSPLGRLRTGYEYLRALHFELGILRRFDRVQVCSEENARVLAEFQPELQDILEPDVRAGIDVARYRYRTDQREPDTMLFVGSFRHAPNREALSWFIGSVLPLVLERRPRAKLVVVGNDQQGRELFPDMDAVEWKGTVEDIQEPLGRYSVLVCPVLSGSGVRVKLLEAFAVGIPTVSTKLGAEGLAAVDGEHCMLADDPDEFAAKIIRIWDNPFDAAAMTQRARQYVGTTRDIGAMTVKLVDSYREIANQKRCAVRPDGPSAIGELIARQ